MNAQHDPVEPNKLLAGEYPGNLDLRITRDRLASLVRLGVRTFIDLTRPEDGLQPYEEHLKELYSSHMPESARIPEGPQTPKQKDCVRSWQSAG